MVSRQPVPVSLMVSLQIVAPMIQVLFLGSVTCGGKGDTVTSFPLSLSLYQFCVLLFDLPVTTSRGTKVEYWDS